MTGSNDFARSGRDALLAEHQALRAILLRLRDAQSRDDMLTLLAEFRRAAEGHFAHEESPDGFFESVLANAPHHQRALEDLRAEHGRFLSEAGELMPQKSTFFYPKLATGLTMHSLMPEA